MPERDPVPDLTLEFLDDPAAFVDAAHGYLAADPVVVNVVAVVAERAVREGIPQAPFHWYAVVRDGAGEVVGAAMRTAPFEPWPLFVLPMPHEAALLLARALHERGEHPGGANGALPAARTVAEESARLWRGELVVAMSTRLWELGELRPPEGVPGRGRLATYDDLELCRAWYADFPRAAREQAGNAETAQGGEEPTPAEMRARIDGRRIVLWEDERGEVVHLTGMSYPVLGVGRIGPVYTPERHRGHGYASAGVAHASALVQKQGRVCLFTDVDNPVSNRIYAALGYEPVVDMANHTVVPART